MAATIENILMADGQNVDVLVGGADSGPALVLHHGTPSDATTWLDWDDVAREHGLQLVALSRPGYATSTRRPGRRVADVAANVREILALCDAPWFVTGGWSGGGPHALACAAQIPGCRAAATFGGVGPPDAADLNFLAGMGPENIDEFGAARSGEHVLRAWIEAHATQMQSVTGAGLAEALGGLLPEVDKNTLADGFAEHMAAVTRRALAPGFDGWIDDDLAFAKPWGFDVSNLDVPVTVWQGDLDLMVPFAHGQWLAERIPGAEPKMLLGHGHISLVTACREEIVHDLVARSVRGRDNSPANF